MFTQKSIAKRISQLPPDQKEAALKFQAFLESKWFNLIVGIIIGVVSTYTGMWFADTVLIGLF